MADNVIPFDNRITPQGEPCDEVVTQLKDLLARAERGEIRAIAFATVNTGGSVNTGWVGCDGTRYPLGAVTSMLQTRYTQALLEPAVLVETFG